MRIIEWNCQGGFRLKNKEILELKPDILIIPECEPIEKLEFGKLTPKLLDFFWYSDTGKKGLGVFSYSNYKFKILKEFNPKYRYVVPIEVTNGQNSFILFAVWAMDNKKDPLARYIGQVWLALNYYKPILNNNSIIIGDFNSNQIWDEKERVGNHTDVVNLLKNYEIESLYHKQYNEKHGEESNKTFFMYRDLKKPYHIDYAFASKGIIKKGYTFSLENAEKWIDKSDHIPLVIDIESFDSTIEICQSYKDVCIKYLQELSINTREKYKTEIDEIIKTAEKLDDSENPIDNKNILISKIEILNQIDSLTTKLIG